MSINNLSFLQNSAVFLFFALCLSLPGGYSVGALVAVLAALCAIPTWRKKKIDADTINNAMIKASKGELKGVLGVEDKPLVSIDYNHNPLSSIFDLSQTQVIKGRLGRILSWYDNEWGFANRMGDTASLIGKLIKS